MLDKTKQALLPLSYSKENDHNFHLGGKSFYFFDFDDNIAYLTTPIILFNKQTNQETSLSSKDFARNHNSIGKYGEYKNFSVDLNDQTGSFRHFRDIDFKKLKKGKNFKQSFVRDIENALNNERDNWKAPSWKMFFHATYNQRPISIITARGHEEETIKNGIDIMVKKGHLPYVPNYLSIYPVSNPSIKNKLKLNHNLNKNITPSIADLKRYAIRESFSKAIKKHGAKAPHRFGMSDDDPKNIAIIIEEMHTLKLLHPHMSFFIIRTFKGHYIKEEILKSSVRVVINKKESTSKQMSLF